MNITYTATIRGRISNVPTAIIERFGLRKQRGAQYFELVATSLSAAQIATLTELIDGSRETYGEGIERVWMNSSVEVAALPIPATLADFHKRVEAATRRSFTLVQLAASVLDNAERMEDAGFLKIPADAFKALNAICVDGVNVNDDIDAHIAAWVAFMPAYREAGAKFNAANGC